MSEITVNLDNLTSNEREQLMKIIEKGNKANKVFQPKLGEMYWCIKYEGDITYFIWQNDRWDEGCFALGNCYPTEEAAEFAKQKKIVTTELERFADEHNEEKIKWGNNDSTKFLIVYDYKNKKLVTCYSNYIKDNNIPFSSKKIARQAIDTIGADRIKKYYLGVND